MNSDIIKPCTGKLWGTYPQRQEGLSMQRIPVPCGRLSGQKLLTLADIADRYTKGTPLHLTTRQSIELHNVPEDKTADVIAELQDMGMSCLGAGGDNVRTITVCPCCSTNPEAFDIEPLAKNICDFMQNVRPQLKLPRKFKISFSGCKSPQSAPFVNDIAFWAVSETAVDVIAAGSLGPRPETGIKLYDNLPIREIVPFIKAALDVFEEFGNRENRRQARLRHVRQQMGDAEFRRILNERFARFKLTSSGPALILKRSSSGWHKTTIQTIAGELSLQAARMIAAIAKSDDLIIKLNLHHGVEIFSRQPLILPGELERMTNLPCIVACPGTSTCKNGIVNCIEIAEQLSNALKGKPAIAGKTIAISGCPNNCSQSSIADIGLIGRLKTVDGEQFEAYQLLLGGGNGRSRCLAEPVEIIAARVLVNRKDEIISRLR